MSEVKRFTRTCDCVTEVSHGEYVLYVDFDAEHALRLAAERQVGELREQLSVAQSEQRVNALDCNEAERKLDTAMGLLESCKSWCEGSLLEERIAAFLNTTSTEGKDHD